jgi:hypothetical protein
MSASPLRACTDYKNSYSFGVGLQLTVTWLTVQDASKHGGGVVKGVPETAAIVPEMSVVLENTFPGFLS